MCESFKKRDTNKQVKGKLQDRMKERVLRGG